MSEKSLENPDAFKINEQGRPQGTVETDKGVVHYTCNPPKDEVLEEMGILAIGGIFPAKDGKQVEKNEVLLIPTKLFEEAGRDISTIEAEALLRDMGKNKK